MHAIERRFAQAQHERPALLQADVRRARQKIVGNARGNPRAENWLPAEQGIAARTHHNRSAGGDAGADVLVRQVFDLFRRSAHKQGRQFSPIRRNHAQFRGQQAQSRFARHKKHMLHARIGVELTVARPARGAAPLAPVTQP